MADKKAESKQDEKKTLTPEQQEAEARKIDQKNASDGHPTMAEGSEGKNVEVRDGATFDNQGKEIKR